MTGKVFIKSFGCQMNEYDAERMADLLRRDLELERCESPQDAQVILLNTCSVREKAQEKLFDELGRLRGFKERDPRVRIGVGGCVASQEGARILERAPFVDVVFGPQTVHRLPALLAERQERDAAAIDISFPLVEKFDALPAPGRRGPRAFVSVMEGCSKYCSFCVVPYTRGPEVSRPVLDVLDEVADLAARGTKEVTLLGQNVNAYLGPDPRGRDAGFARLLECVAEVDGIERIRYTTSHPVNCTDALAAAHGSLPQLMPHMHLPVQSGDDRILARMKRGHTVIEYKQIIRRLRRARPDLALTSDFIVGFPGETEEQFERTLELARWVGYDGGFSFIYSPRPGTPAASLEGQVPRPVQVARLERLQAELAASSARLGEALVGSEQQVLVEGPAKKGALMQGRLPNNRLALFAGPAAAGELRTLRIHALRGATLRGELLD